MEQHEKTPATLEHNHNGAVPEFAQLGNLSMTETDNEMIARLEAVTDANSFLAFVHALVADRESAVQRERTQPSSPWGPDAGGWENTRIETYLEAAASWAESTDFGVSQGLDANNLWLRFATFLRVGKIYE
jgi:hypothetical protein